RHLYELCDELGLMVWQDFLFACATYAEEPPLRDEVIAEARENVARLRRPRAWRSGTATTRTSGATRSGAGPTSSGTRPGAAATTSTCCRGSWPSSTRPGRTARAARGR